MKDINVEPRERFDCVGVLGPVWYATLIMQSKIIKFFVEFVKNIGDIKKWIFSNLIAFEVRGISKTLMCCFKARALQVQAKYLLGSADRLPDSESVWFS